MSELSAWVFKTLGQDIWPKRIIDGEAHIQYPSQRERDIVAHYEREVGRGRLTLCQGYEKACNDLQGRNGHISKPQHGKRYSAVQVNIIRGEAQ